MYLWLALNLLMSTTHLVWHKVSTPRPHQSPGQWVIGSHRIEDFTSGLGWHGVYHERRRSGRNEVMYIINVQVGFGYKLKGINKIQHKVHINISWMNGSHPFIYIKCLRDVQQMYDITLDVIFTLFIVNQDISYMSGRNPSNGIHYNMI